MFKMGSDILFKYISYGQNKGRESNYQCDFQPLKVRNLLDLLMCRWHVTYRWKLLDEGYKFALNLTLVEGLHKMLWVSKIAKVLILKILRLPT
jgi:hypothetical protein